MQGFDSIGSIGKMLMILGIIMLITGAAFYFGGKLFNLGRLPGDIYFERDNFSFHFPIVTSIIISIILTIILNIFIRR
ncbi:MAG TPA: DUF2905 domain-containing protein [Methylomusa anaerophila]|uniref:DUF2905 domain-containing protein n=1 Tax=Methylomusa anaerophila TaxID=1930071 RepID=A0A348AP64_9FIRM|nr:DUF2905 domain-containing protein [Methylomusa anaerophila]BBB92862.1 hypothetical protein MAMMFC1_03570 [Methylomusa anaerophila]HML87302.1 DUF2905 domain-containing protein [Methylomusa anaerophila]